MGRACYLTSARLDQRRIEEKRWRECEEKEAWVRGSNVCTLSQRWHACRQLRAPIKLAPRHNETLMKLCCCRMVMHSLRGVRDRDWPERAQEVSSSAITHLTWRNSWEVSPGHTVKTCCFKQSTLRSRIRLQVQWMMKKGVTSDLSLSWFNWWACHLLVK